jgi:hypothetical protein
MAGTTRADVSQRKVILMHTNFFDVLYSLFFTIRLELHQTLILVVLVSPTTESAYVSWLFIMHARASVTPHYIFYTSTILLHTSTPTLHMHLCLISLKPK